jgi:8-oxo-dGTP pyrophosphatase MutT (NUDIX family)
LRGSRLLPATLAERARAFVAEGLAPVAARPASTVVLLRDGAPGLEAYVLRRRTSMAFAGGMHAFPGGVVDPRDTDENTLRWLGPLPAEWAFRLRASEPAARGFVCAAVRETFEEAGVLLAAPDEGAAVVPVGAQWEAERKALVARELAMSDLLEHRGLALRSDLLAPWAHWVTPRFEPRRYDTWFFLAALPQGQEALDVSGEADRVAWVRPHDAVAAAQAGDVGMLPPTWTVLDELSEHDTVGSALAAADDRALDTITPGWSDDGDAVRVVLPGDPGFPGDDPGEPA